MLVQGWVHECLRPLVCTSVRSMGVWLFVCLRVELFYGKTFPCCLGLVCAGAILSCRHDCNEQLAAHQALIGTWFPWEIAGASVRVSGVQPHAGNAGAGLCVCEHRRSQHCALCRWGSLAPAGRICSKLAASKPPGPAKLSDWPPKFVAPLLALARPLE